MFAVRKSTSSSSLIFTVSRLDAISGPLAGVAGEDALVREDQGRSVVDRGRDLTEADGDQPDLAVVLRDVAGGEHPRQVRAHRGVDLDVALVELHAPVLHRGE